MGLNLTSEICPLQFRAKRGLCESLRFKRPFHLVPNLLRKVFEQFDFGSARDTAWSRQPYRHDFLEGAGARGKKPLPIAEKNRLVQTMSHIDEGPFGLLPDANQFYLQHLAGLGIQ